MPKLFDDLRERLLIAGIAPRHVRRYIAELEDHLADLRREAGSQAFARLGTLDDLAKPMLARPELRSLASRYPLTVLGIGPVALWLGLTLGTAVLVDIAGPLSHGIDLLPPPGPSVAWVYRFVYAVTFLYLRILPAAFAMLTMVSALRQRSPLPMSVIGAALVLVMSCTLTFTVTPSTVPGEQGVLQVTSWLLPFLVPFTDALGPMNGIALVSGLMEAVVVLAAIMGVSLFWRRQHQRQTKRHYADVA